MIRMSPGECKAQLESNLEESLENACQLKVILEGERAALERNDPASLHDAATCKQDSVTRLEELETKRVSLSQSCGFESGADAINDLAIWCGGGPAMVGSWKEFLDIANECSKLNSANGAIILVRRSQIENTLAVLRGGTANSDTYGPAGEKAGILETRALAEA